MYYISPALISHCILNTNLSQTHTAACLLCTFRIRFSTRDSSFPILSFIVSIHFDNLLYLNIIDTQM